MAKQATLLEPARTVIEICGGPAATAKIVERHPISVIRWGYPKERGGSNGRIPTEAVPLLLAAARRNGIDLRLEHFFLEEEKAGAAPQ